MPEPETESLPDKLPEALPDVAPVNITDGAPETTMAYGAPPNLEARQKYERIMRLLDINETRQFQTEMREWLEENTGDTLEPDALYWLAEAHYVSKQRKQARYYYSRLLERFPKTSRREITLLKLAQLHYDEGEYAHARSILNKLLSSDNSTIRRLAKEQLGRKPPQ